MRAVLAGLTVAAVALLLPGACNPQPAPDTRTFPAELVRTIGG